MIWENLLTIEFNGNIEYIETDANKVALTALMTGMNKDDKADSDVISAYLYVAGRNVMQRCYPFGIPADQKIPERYGTLQCEIAAYLLNKRGAEGQKSHSENGIVRVYESGGIPESFLSQITPRGAVY